MTTTAPALAACLTELADASIAAIEADKAHEAALTALHAARCRRDVAAYTATQAGVESPHLLAGMGTEGACVLAELAYVALCGASTDEINARAAALQSAVVRRMMSYEWQAEGDDRVRDAHVGVDLSLSEGRDVHITTYVAEADERGQREYRVLIHGRTCPKAAHGEQGGYLHAADDDPPYDVDGVTYCGRCHVVLPYDRSNECATCDTDPPRSGEECCECGSVY